METTTIGRLLTPKETAERLRSTLSQLAAWRYAGTGPKFYKLGYRTIRYDANSVEAWLLGRKEASQR